MLNLKLIFLLVTLIHLQPLKALTPNPKIVIIGAGPSGLATGTKLLEYGFDDVTILEAESRIGGRIYTIPFADNNVDLGAQWCHGEKDNIVYEMVEKYNLLQHSTGAERRTNFMRSNQELVDTNISKRLVGIVDEITSENLDEQKNDDRSLAEYISEKFWKILELPENQDIDKTIAKEFLETFDHIWCSNEGSDTLSQVSTSSQSESIECAGDQLLAWKGTGYKVFLDILLKTNETGKDCGVLDNKIQISKKVKQIQWKRDDGKVLINTEDGEEILADHVIVTVSLGVLKADYEKLFEPELPAEKINAIKNIGFGTVNKIYLEYEKPMWLSDWTGVTILWRKEDLDDLEATKRTWLTDVFGFWVVASQPRILSGWVVGPHRPEYQDLSDDEVKNATLYLLARFAPDKKLSEPINFLRTNWGVEPNFHGSYSYHSMETAATNAKNSDLAEPLYGGDDKMKPLVQFAGEATHDHYYSTVHGAVSSGFREAKRLKDFYDSKKLN